MLVKEIIWLLNLEKRKKRLFPLNITGRNSGNTYPASIGINYKDLIKNRIYNIDYRLVKEVSEIFSQKALTIKSSNKNDNE